MNTTSFIRSSLHSGQGWLFALIQDMKDSPLTQPTPKGGNHPLWVLGHIVRGESDLLDGFILGQENRFPELANCAMGQEPSTDASDYPSLDELTQKFQEIRTTSLDHLDSLSDEDLDKKSHAPEQFGDFFGTVGACYAAMISHMAFHSGQVADARRAAGRSPLFAAT